MLELNDEWAVLNDEWAVTRRYMSLETVRDVCNDATMDVAQIASI